MVCYNLNHFNYLIQIYNAINSSHHDSRNFRSKFMTLFSKPTADSINANALAAAKFRLAEALTLRDMNNADIACYESIIDRLEPKHDVAANP
jgi:hypothetical protein